jgi:dienelactone hydrolase
MRGLLWCASGVLAVLLVGACSGPSRTSDVRLDAGPAAAAFITPVHIAISGLPPGLVTVRAQTRDSQGRPWQSSAQFRVSGSLNLATAVPVSGSYHVADAAGLLWSLQPAFTRDPTTQFYIGAHGFDVRLQVLAGGSVLATTTMDRLWSPASPPSVQTVRSNGFASTLFAPAKTNPTAPAVVVIGGSEGGEPALTAAALSMAGYPALALGYFKEPGLPQCLCDIPLEYFAHAANWFRDQPVARGRPLILLGVSRGAEGALLIASYEPRLFSAVVASSPSDTINPAFGAGSLTAAAWTFHGTPLPIGPPIPVGRIRVPLLLGDGGQDAIWDSALSSTFIMQELRAARDPAPRINLYYPLAGHAILGAPPYFPSSSYGPGGMLRGGTPQANALARDQSWASLISFLNDPWPHPK